eukprot:1150138-Pelagomonas_calceolata.AAC.8
MSDLLHLGVQLQALNTGRMCADCAEGYFRAFDNCLECISPGGNIIAMLVSRTWKQSTCKSSLIKHTGIGPTLLQSCEVEQLLLSAVVWSLILAALGYMLSIIALHKAICEYFGFHHLLIANKQASLAHTLGGEMCISRPKYACLLSVRGAACIPPDFTQEEKEHHFRRTAHLRNVSKTAS